MKKNIILIILLTGLICYPRTKIVAANTVNSVNDTYYFIPNSGDANILSNWNTKPDGTGTSPSSLYNTNRIYVINNSKSATLTGSFGGEGVYVSVGDETGGSLGTGTSGILTTYAGNVFFRAKINVNKNSILNYRMTTGAAYYPDLAFCDPSSIVNYNGTTAQNVIAANYGNLNINNIAGTTLLGDVGISTTLTTTTGTINTTTNNGGINFNGSQPQTMPGNSSYTGENVHQITINNNSGVRLVENTTLTVLDSLIVNSGTLTLGTGSTLNIKGKSYIPSTPKVDSTYKAGYTLAWNDEFDGTANSFPNPKYWVQHYTSTVPQSFTTWGQTFTSNNIKKYNYLDGQGHFISKTNDSLGVYYTGGCIATAWPYYMMKKYGYLESKLTFTRNNGVNCTFWLQSPTIGQNPTADDPATYGAEIDICEYLGPSTTSPFGRVNTTIHKNGYDEAYHKQLGNDAAPDVSNGGWHTIALEWSPTYYKFYTDGVLTWTVTDTAWISKHPAMLILGSGVGWTPPNSVGNTWPVYMKVDYVRVYNKN